MGTRVITIRRVDATREDVANTLRGLQLLCMPSDEPYPIKGSLWWVGYMQGAPVGFGGLKPLPAERGVGFLCRAGVLEHARGQGLHGRLIRARVAAARRMGMHLVVTYTLSLNAASSNNLIHESFESYTPAELWAGSAVVYWCRKLKG